MKKLILLPFIIISLSACKKMGVLPDKPSTKTASTGAVITGDTIPDKAGFRLRLAKDSTNRDETMIVFNCHADTNYIANDDGLYFPGFGLQSLASISGDGKDLSIYTTPYRPGMKIGLDVGAKTDGTFTLSMSYQHQIPANVQVWLKDAYLKDSIDVRSASYAFTISKADTSSFGKQRFNITIRENNIQQTAPLH
ncbi:MAG TPA: hypothetical protein VHC47_11615 [Mucilaginibacter sp.]|nr:hypothetical protein [Mucilaginibacter sp.]